MAGLLDGGPRALEALRAAADPGRIADEGRPLDEIELLAPVPRPGKVVAIGRNYREHVDEEGADRPPAPLIFSKWPSSVIGDGAEIRWDPELTAQVDYEAELAVVIGRTARRVSEADALDHVLGYTCLNDVSARDLQFGDGQWARGKSLDTFCPMGPALVTADEIPDPAGSRHLVLGGRSDRPVGEHQPDVLRGRRDHQLLLAVVQPGAGRRHRDRDARRRRHLPRSAGPARRRRRGDRRDRGGRTAAQHLPLSSTPPWRAHEHAGGAVPRHGRARLHRRLDGPRPGPRRRAGGRPRCRERCPPPAADHDPRRARCRHVRDRRHHRPGVGRRGPRRQRDHERHPPGGAPGSRSAAPTLPAAPW